MTWPAPASTRGRNGLAVASLVLGLVWLYGVGSLLAVIFGFIALGQIRRHHEEGRGMAIAGIILGGAGLLLPAILAAVVVFAVRDTSSAAACDRERRNLRAAVEWFNDVEDRYPTTQQEMVDAGYLNEPSEWYDFDVTSAYVTITLTEAGIEEGCTTI